MSAQTSIVQPESPVYASANLQRLDADTTSPGKTPSVISLESGNEDASSGDDNHSSENQSDDEGWNVVNGRLSIDVQWQPHKMCIAETLFAFLLTHAPSTRNEPLGGMFTMGEQIAEECHCNSRSLVGDVCDMLGFMSVNLGSPLALILDTKSVDWYTMMARQCMAGTIYTTSRRSSEQLWSRYQVGFGESSGHSFSTYHWHLLREMSYWSRRLEISNTRPQRGPKLGERDWAKGHEGLSEWFLQETKNEESQYGEHYLFWYGMPIPEKIARLDNIIDFLSRRLPADRDANMPSVRGSGMRGRALESQPEIFQDFVEMKSLRAAFRRERQTWRGVLEARQQRGRCNPVYSGFPNSRQYRLLADTVELYSPTNEEDEEKYPATVIKRVFVPRFRAPHPNLPAYQRSDLLSGEVSRQLDLMLLEFGTTTTNP